MKQITITDPSIASKLKMLNKRHTFITDTRDEYSEHHCREVVRSDFQDDDKSKVYIVHTPKQIPLSVFLSRVARWLGVEATVRNCQINTKNCVWVDRSFSKFWTDSLMGFELLTLFTRSYYLLENVDVNFTTWLQLVPDKDLFSTEVVYFIKKFKALSLKLKEKKVSLDSFDYSIIEEDGLCAVILSDDSEYGLIRQLREYFDSKTLFKN